MNTAGLRPRYTDPQNEPASGGHCFGGDREADGAGQSRGLSGRVTNPGIPMYNFRMAKHVIHISEAEATTNFASLLARVRAGAEVIIEHDARPVAVLHPAEPSVRLLSESLRLARQHGSMATIDEDFAKDVAAAVESHREPLNPPAWD